MVITHIHAAVPNEVIQSAFWNQNHQGTATPADHGNEVHTPDFQDAATYGAHDHSAADPTQVSHANLTNVSSDQHHGKQHAITAGADHTSGATPGQVLKADANGLPIDATNTDAEVADAVTKKHTRQHAITDGSDHTSTATPGKVLQADANGLPVDATNTNADVADAVTKKHSQNTDTSLKSNATTGVMQITGPAAGTTRVKTIRDANDTIVELGGGGTFTAAVEAADHGAAATDQVINVCYGTGDPPAANTTTEGSLFVKYTA